MKHLVLGGCGFTGSHLVRALIDAGEEVVVCDLANTQDRVAIGARFLAIDVTDPGSLARLPLEQDDIVHHLAARQYHLPVPWGGRVRYFEEVNHKGTRHVLELMQQRGCCNLIFFSSDMVYGLPRQVPIATSHPRNPLGPYGLSKKQGEDACAQYRTQGFRITILRPRLIVGPGRLGVLARLFGLIEKDLPLPLIGDGSNYYQMVSVYDCVSADLAAVAHGIPNESYNLGSKDPPRVIDLLEHLIERAGSRSFCMKVPSWGVKPVLALLDLVGATLLYKEQYAIADIQYVVDISKAGRELDWTPRYRDQDMLVDAFGEYKRHRDLVARRT